MTSSQGVHWIERRTRQGRTGFSIDGPLRVEAEDLPAELAAAVLMPRWILELSVPAGSPGPVWTMAVKTGRHLADAAEGVLFDPQEDRIVWPRSAQRRMPKAEGARSTSVEFAWALPADAFTEELPRRLLALFRRLLPEALPRRYGAFEPLQHRLDEGDDAFVTRWLDEQGSAVGLLFWKGSRPVGEGLVSFPSHGRPDEGVSAGAIESQVDGRVFDDARWRELAVVLLDEVGALSSAFYGRALAEARREGGVPAYELAGMAPPLVSRGAWSGLPDHPAWLTWLGPGYAEIVAGALPADAVSAARHGIIVRRSELPALSSELLPWIDRFPAEHCRLSDPPSTDRARHLERFGDRTWPAARIPVGDHG